MKKTRFSETQIVTILQSHESGRTVKEICSKGEISKPTFYNLKAKYGGMEVSDVRRMKDLEDENSRLKHIVANLTFEVDAVKNVLQKKHDGLTIREKQQIS
jgi:putative transposase